MSLRKKKSLLKKEVILKKKLKKVILKESHLCILFQIFVAFSEYMTIKSLFRKKKLSIL